MGSSNRHALRSAHRPLRLCRQESLRFQKANQAQALLLQGHHQPSAGPQDDLCPTRLRARCHLAGRYGFLLRVGLYRAA